MQRGWYNQLPSSPWRVAAFTLINNGVLLLNNSSKAGCDRPRSNNHFLEWSVISTRLKINHTDSAPTRSRALSGAGGSHQDCSSAIQTNQSSAFTNECTQHNGSDTRNNRRYRNKMKWQQKQRKIFVMWSSWAPRPSIPGQTKVHWAEYTAPHSRPFWVVAEGGRRGGNAPF